MTLEKFFQAFQTKQIWHRDFHYNEMSKFIKHSTVTFWIV